MRVLRSLAAIVLALATAACALFGATEAESTTLEELPVVADGQAFDPSQAVDDDDDLEPWQPRTEQDVDAFARSDSKVRNSESGAKETPAASGRGARAPRAGRQEEGAEGGLRGEPPGATLPADEHVAGPGEVQQRRTQRRQEFSSIDSEERADGDAKAEFAGNPPAEEVGKSKSTVWTLLDYSFEATLLLIGASVVTALIGLARRFPKPVVLAVTVGLAALVVAVASQGE